jgi:hypothetical protein
VSESQINAAAAPIAADVRGCFAEWRERSRELEAEAALVVRVFPDGPGPARRRRSARRPRHGLP